MHFYSFLIQWFSKYQPKLTIYGKGMLHVPPVILIASKRERKDLSFRFFSNLLCSFTGLFGKCSLCFKNTQDPNSRIKIKRTFHDAT